MFRLSFQTQCRSRRPNSPSPAGQLPAPWVSRMGRRPHWSFAYDSSGLFLLNCFYGALAQELCHCGHKLFSRPRGPGQGRLSQRLQARTGARSGLCPQAQCPGEATWSPWLSHHWTGCPIAALSQPAGGSWNLCPGAAHLLESRARHAESNKLRNCGLRGITLATEYGKPYMVFHA